MASIYERESRRAVLDQGLQTRTMTLFSLHAREFLARSTISHDHIVGLLVDKSWAHGIPTHESDVDAWILSRGELSRRKLEMFNRRLNRFFEHLIIEESLPGMNVLDVDIDSIDIVGEEDRAALQGIFEYNRNIPLILISSQRYLSKELAGLGVATVEYR